MKNPTEIAIIGDGYAAAVMAVHLLRKGLPGNSIALIGPRVPGKGNAFTCASSFFRLNVREDLPTIFSEDPLHFARWAQDHLNDPEAKTDAGYFYRRRDFGNYVVQLLSDTEGATEVQHVLAKVTQLRQEGGHWAIATDDGSQLSAKQVIIATGNAPPVWPCAVNSSDQSSGRMVENPWPGDYLERIQADDHVMLLGGGLTALDAINALVGQGHRGMVSVISPRAMFPPVQAPWKRCNQPQMPRNLSPGRLVRFMRDYLPKVSADSPEWQNTWEELRPHLNEVWQQFSAQERRSLLKRLGWIWSLYRFRASPQTIAAYKHLQARNQVQFALGRAKHITHSEEKIRVRMSSGAELVGDRIINCTGIGSDPLTSELIASGIAAPDALLQSIAVDTHLRVMNSDHQPHINLWMIGPATMGSLGDVVASSAIAKQAEQLADQIAKQER
jgi:uncharacterized NAD(P)/FAD-binding protein YdhS